MKKIGIMIGSDSDLPQCLMGLKFLREAQSRGECRVVIVITNSIHRNTKEVLKNLRLYSHRLDAWVIGAGWANHLTGTCDAYLRYTLKNIQTRVFGVAFEDRENSDNTRAAVLSIIKVPGTQVLYDDYIGEEGFLKACKDIVFPPCNLPPIKIGVPKPVVKRTHYEAIEAARAKTK